VAIIQVSSAPSRAIYDAIQELVGIAANRPAGLIVHGAAEVEDGTVLIIDVWGSSETMAAFERDRLLPAFQQMPGGPEVAMANKPVPHLAFELVRG
jgi:hypothetical protein